MYFIVVERADKRGFGIMIVVFYAHYSAAARTACHPARGRRAPAEHIHVIFIHAQRQNIVVFYKNYAFLHHFRRKRFTLRGSLLYRLTVHYGRTYEGGYQVGKQSCRNIHHDDQHDKKSYYRKTYHPCQLKSAFILSLGHKFLLFYCTAPKVFVTAKTYRYAFCG